MAAKKQQAWQTISLTPMTGQLDARFRPTETPDGGFKEKQNLSVSENGKLTRKCGFQRLFATSLANISDTSYPTLAEAEQNCPGGSTITLEGGLYFCQKYINWDFHQRNVDVRKPITGLFEVTKSDDTRYLFSATESEVSVLNETAGTWADIFSGSTTGGKVKMDVLQDTVIMIDRKNFIYAYNLGDSNVHGIADLGTLQVNSAKVVIQFNGFILLMNTVEAGVPNPSRVRYSDLDKPESYVPDPSSLANFQDIDYGEEILAAALLQSDLIIYTNRSIWRCFVSVDTSANTSLGFTKIYTEPKNNAGCLVYPDSLVSTGDSHYYGSREAFYTYNPYLTAPESPEWLRQATGVIYTDKNRKIDPSCCLSMVTEYRPLTNEVWVSWPSSGQACLNNKTLILNTKFLTGYFMDAGFSALTNYKPNPLITSDCNVAQILVGASTMDYSLKEIGAVLFREFVRQTPSVDDPNPTVDENITTPIYSQSGYTSILRGVIPTSLFDVEKLLRKIILGEYTSPQPSPCIARLRIGTSNILTDPNNTTYCQIVWHPISPDLILACPENLTADQMVAQNLIPSQNAHWDCYERGKYLYFEITILNQDGSPAIGGDTHWHKLDFEIFPLQT